MVYLSSPLAYWSRAPVLYERLPPLSPIVMTNICVLIGTQRPGLVSSQNGLEATHDNPYSFVATVFWTPSLLHNTPFHRRHCTTLGLVALRSSFALLPCCLPTCALHTPGTSSPCYLSLLGPHLELLPPTHPNRHHLSLPLRHLGALHGLAATRSSVKCSVPAVHPNTITACA